MVSKGSGCTWRCKADRHLPVLTLSVRDGPPEPCSDQLPSSKKFSKTRLSFRMWMSLPAPCPSPGGENLVSSTSYQLKPVVEPGCRARAWTHLMQTLVKPQAGCAVAKMHVSFSRKANELFVGDV